jgi:hypothetical protein
MSRPRGIHAARITEAQRLSMARGRGRDQRKFSPGEVALMRRLRTGGAKLGHIADVLDCSIKAVWARVKDIPAKGMWSR